MMNDDAGWPLHVKGTIMRIKMKKVNIFLFILLSVVFNACSDSGTENNESIVGAWTWYETSGGVGGIVETPQTTGETRGVVFQENGNVTFHTNGEVTLVSTYTLAIENTILSDTPLPVVKVNGGFSYIYSFPYVDELELQETVIDGFIHNYRGK